MTKQNWRMADGWSRIMGIGQSRNKERGMLVFGLCSDLKSKNGLGRSLSFLQNAVLSMFLHICIACPAHLHATREDKAA